MSGIQKLFFTIVILLFAGIAKGQLTSSSADSTGNTVFGDKYFIFCSGGGDISKGSLTAESKYADAATFTWEKYDSLANAFVLLTNTYPVTEDSVRSTISKLDDGCYRVTVSSNGNTYQEKAWVLNNWIEVTYTEIPDSSSNCVEFKIWADFDYALLNVYNTSNGERSNVRDSGKFTYIWQQDKNSVSDKLSPLITENLIASETPVEYDLTITDEFGCTGTGSVDYISKVTKADFSVDPTSGEAVLEVAFTNNSINYDSTLWFFYKGSQRITVEQQELNGDPVDSIDFVLYEDAPVFQFEHTGDYKIKLVTVKINDTGNCRDTFYIPKNIEVEASLVEVPNFFSPGNDDVNENWVIKTKSLKSMNVKIYNRWGELVHSWKYSNITSSDYTYEHSVWDGRIGNRLAATGVYFYVISYEGRDIYTSNEDEEGNRQRLGEPVKGVKKGFVHLFRGK